MGGANESGLMPVAGGCVRLQPRPLGRSRLYCLPSLVIVGAMKAGTSALCDLLERQPLLQRNADGSEVHYFSDPFASPRRLVASWPRYAARFPLSRRQVARGVRTFEKTAQYLTSAGGLGAMRAVLGAGVRVVVVLREPGARLYSEFQHHCRSGRVVRIVDGSGAKWRSTGALHRPLP